MADMGFLSKMNDGEIIDLLIQRNKEESEIKREIEAMKSELQARGLSVLNDRNTKFYEFTKGTSGIANIIMAQKVDIINYFELCRVLGEEFTSEKVIRRKEVKYDIDKKFNQALVAIVTGDYERDVTIEEVIERITHSPKERAILIKSLKGDYNADKKKILSVLKLEEGERDIDVELFFIYKIKNWELIKSFLGEKDIEDKMRKIKKYVGIDESIKIALKAFKD